MDLTPESAEFDDDETEYWRLYLGKNHSHAQECLDGGFVGAHYDVHEDLTGKLPDNWRDFNAEFMPKWLTSHPEKSNIAAGLACGMLWTVARGYAINDIVLCPTSSAVFHVGVVAGPYEYVPESNLPHRRAVQWLGKTLLKDEMSDELRKAVQSPGTSANLTSYRDELRSLISGNGSVSPGVAAIGETQMAFALESHLELFITANWSATPFGSTHKIFEDDGVQVGKQYQTDTGPLDILAVSHDGKELLVIELKKGASDDAVVGQVLRYMGYVSEVLANSGESVRGAVIALDDKKGRIRRALSQVPNVDFYRYEVDFRLLKE